MSTYRQNRFIRQALYQLKRQFGLSMRLIRRDQSGGVDFETGVTDYSREAYDIDRAILLPAKGSRSFDYARIEVQWSYGAYFDITDRTFIVDTHDLPAGFKPKKDDYIITTEDDGRKRYDIFRIEDYEQGRGFVIVAREVETDGEQLYDVINVLAENRLEMIGDGDGVK